MLTQSDLRCSPLLCLFFTKAAVRLGCCPIVLPYLAREIFIVGERCFCNPNFRVVGNSEIILSEGKLSEALDTAKQAMLALPKAQFLWVAVAARDWLEMIANAAQQNRSSVELSVVIPCGQFEHASVPFGFPMVRGVYFLLETQ